LYQSVLEGLAAAREEKRITPAKQCLDLMQHLAYTMQTDPKGKQAEVTRFAAARILAPRFRGVPEDEQHAAAERFLDEEEIDSGILVSRGDTLRFWHLTFQEYLAAAALAWRDANRPRLLFDEKKLYLPEWRETVLLLAGILCTQGQERIDALLAGILDGLGNDAPLATRARAVGLIGRILRDLQSWNYRIDPSGRRRVGGTCRRSCRGPGCFGWRCFCPREYGGRYFFGVLAVGVHLRFGGHVVGPFNSIVG
jgi:hypothetical protein